MTITFLAQAESNTPSPSTPQNEPELTINGEKAVESILETLISIWHEFVAHLPLIGAGILILFGTWMVASIFDRFSSSILSRFSFRGSLRELIRRLTHITVWMLGIIIAAMIVFPGLTPTRALAGLGLSSIAIGFAFKDIFENFFAGVLILWRFPFESGDYVECNGIMGKIEDVTVRNTLIRKPTGELVVVPNATIFKNPVDVLTNWNLRRITTICGIAYGEDIDNARTVIKKALESCSSISKDKPVEVFAQEFGASSVDFEVTWWTQPTPKKVRESKDQVISAVKSALDEAGIEIPFPYRTLTFSEPIEVRQPQLEPQTESD